MADLHQVGGSTPKTLSILFMNWRDCRNPEGGGSEIYVETVARALAAAGNDVTIHTSAFPGSLAEEWVDGVRIVRSGTKLGVYPRAFFELRRGVLGKPDIVIDVQNGVPWGSTWAQHAPTVVLVHHVHREQWPVVYGPIRARIGWWLESKAAPRIYAKARYIAVSDVTRSELVGLGIDGDRIDVVHNGVQSRSGHLGEPKTENPSILVLGRLVPHKRAEHVIRAAAELREEIPGLTVSVVGEGWWRDELEAEAARLGVADIVTFHGFVSDDEKQQQLQRAWLLALPSLKEGWGLVVTEAAAHGVPSVAYRAAGGVAEAIRDGESGVLVDGGEAEFTEAIRRILTDDELRGSLARGSVIRADSLSWTSTAEKFADVLSAVLGRKVPVAEILEESTLATVTAEQLH